MDAKGPLNTISTLWIGKEIPLLPQICITSFVKHGHQFQLYTYDKKLKPPQGVILKDANTILPEDAISRDKKGRVTAFSDYFRYKLLQKEDTWWVDTDVICLRPFDHESDYVFGRQSLKEVNNAVLKIPRNSPLLEELIYFCENPNVIRATDKFKVKARKTFRRLSRRNEVGVVRFGELGPQLLTYLANKNNLQDKATHASEFYPISTYQAMYPFDGVAQIDWFHQQGSYAIHLWNEVLSKSLGDKRDGPYHANSIIGKLCQEYNIPSNFNTSTASTTQTASS